MKVLPQATTRLAVWAVAASAAPEAPVDTYEVARELGTAGFSFGSSGFWDDTPRPITPEEAAARLAGGKAVDVRGTDADGWLRCDRNDLPELSRYARHAPEDELATRLRNRTAGGTLFGSANEGRGEFRAYQALLHGQPIWMARGDKWLQVQNLEELRLLDYLDGQTVTLEKPDVARSLAKLGRVHREVSGEDVTDFQSRALVAYRGESLWVGPSLWVDPKMLADPEKVEKDFQPFWQLREGLGNGYRAARAFEAVREQGARPFEERMQAALACFRTEEGGHCFPTMVGAEGRPAAMDERVALLERLRQLVGEGDGLCPLKDAFHHATREVPRLAPAGREDEWVEHYLTLLGQIRDASGALGKLKKMKHDVTRERIDSASWKNTRWFAPELIRPTRRRSRCGTRDQRRAAAVRIYALRRQAGESARIFKQLFPPQRARDPIATADSFCRLSRRLDELGLPDWQTRVQAVAFLDERCQDDLASGLDRLTELLGRQSLMGDGPSLERALLSWEEGPVKTGLEEREGRLIVGGVTVRVNERAS